MFESAIVYLDYVGAVKVPTGGQVPSAQDVDHIIDLQLGGADEISNMVGLDTSVNKSLKAQIHQLIENLPDGTRIGNVTIVDR